MPNYGCILTVTSKLQPFRGMQSATTASSLPLLVDRHDGGFTATPDGHYGSKALYSCKFQEGSSPSVQSPSLMPSSAAEHLWQPLLTPSPISCGPHRLFAPTLPLPTFCFILAPNSSSYSSQTHKPLLPGKQVGWLLPVDLPLSLCTSRPTPALSPVL